MQTGILDPVPAQARHLFFSIGANASAAAVRSALAGMAEVIDGRSVVAGVGWPVTTLLGRPIAGLRGFPALRTQGQPSLEIPATQHALWCWVRGAEGCDAGAVLHAGRALEAVVAPAFRLDDALDVFRHGSGRDLTGYEDGTENPQGDDAAAAAFVTDEGPGYDGASFAAFQRWQHDFTSFQSMAPAARDDAIGRRLDDNEELEDAPASAHVKRTAQESFDPEAFVVRRSMPWIEGMHSGLAFLAFGRTLAAFEVQMRRMAGLDDGIVDALFGFSRPLTGAYFWCPPVRDGRLDKPIGTLLLLWPTLWALWIASDGSVSWPMIWIFCLGTLLMRSAGCAVNDYADRDFDKHVKRTAERPITSGRVSGKEAWALAALLAVCAFFLIIKLNKLVWLLAVVALFLAVSYPYTKRFLAVPQAYLGVRSGSASRWLMRPYRASCLPRRGGCFWPTSSGRSPTTPNMRWWIVTMTSASAFAPRRLHLVASMC